MSTPLGYQYAPVVLGGAPLPLPDGHQPQAAYMYANNVSGLASRSIRREKAFALTVLQTARPWPAFGKPPSVPHQRTGESEAAVALLLPPPLKATALREPVEVLTKAPILSHIAPHPPSIQISVWNTAPSVRKHSGPSKNRRLQAVVSHQLAEVVPQLFNLRQLQRLVLGLSHGGLPRERGGLGTRVVPARVCPVPRLCQDETRDFRMQRAGIDSLK
eukprot:COSAG04_NODE_195_length_20819_cov_5.821718_3_plen_217_part_00